MKILQINTTVNSGSHGRIAEDIGRIILLNGHESYIGYGRTYNPSDSIVLKIGTKFDVGSHLLKSRIFDQHGFGSSNATKKFTRLVKSIDLDIIHLHNIHGYYLNVEVLFNYLKHAGKPVIWTLHDCWPFTGHCCYFDAVNCYKWQTECFDCPNIRGYPESWIRDNSRSNFHRKKSLFTGLKRLTIVVPSNWLAIHVKKSFLKEYPVRVINNGIDLNAFTPVFNTKVMEKYRLKPGHYILGAANNWDDRKGFKDFIKVRNHLPPETAIALIGLNSKQIKNLPEKIIGIKRTESLDELAALYSGATVFVNPTYVDNFPSTNLESLACGTPVITYDTGGSPEAIDPETGIVVPRGDNAGLINAIATIFSLGKDKFKESCRLRAEMLYDKNKRYIEYLSLYLKLVENNLQNFTRVEENNYHKSRFRLSND